MNYNPKAFSFISNIVFKINYKVNFNWSLLWIERTRIMVLFSGMKDYFVTHMTDKLKIGVSDVLYIEIRAIYLRLVMAWCVRVVVGRGLYHSKVLTDMVTHKYNFRRTHLSSDFAYTKIFLKRLTHSIYSHVTWIQQICRLID